MEGPLSSYSCFEIHICWNVDSDARIEPPIHTEYFLSAGATILIFIAGGANEDNSFTILSPIPARLNETTFIAFLRLKNLNPGAKLCLL